MPRAIFVQRSVGHAQGWRKKEPDIDHFIRSLHDTLVAAERNYEVWQVYRGVDTRPRYVASMNRYLGFFSTSIHAHFVANIIALYRLFETRRDTINLNRLLKALPSEKQSTLPPDFQQRMERGRELWKKISIIRNKCFGHLDGESGVSEMFKLAALTPNEMRELMALSKGILNDISLAWNRSTHAFNLDAHDDTVRLLEDLNSLGGR